MRIFRTAGRPSLALAVLGIGLCAAAACGGDDGGGEDEEAVKTTLLGAVQAFNDKQAEEFYSYFTDEGLASLFEVPVEDLDEFKSGFAEGIGTEEELANANVQNVKVDGDSATAELILDSSGTIEGDLFTLAKQDDDAWKISEADPYVINPDIPDGYTTAQMKTQEFAFGIDPTTIKTGKMAFEAENIGQQTHEVALVGIEPDVNLEEALQSEGDPEGVELIARIELDPGNSYNMVLTDDLAPGRYAFVCFMPDTSDPEETPHALKGMVTEFTLE